MRYLLAVAALACALAPVRAQETAQPPAVPKTSDKAVLDRARVLKRPIYPDDARGEGLDGTVAVRLLVSPGGEVISARAVSGPEPLREAAAKAAEAWEFASSELPDNAVGFLLFRFSAASHYAAIVGIRDEDLAEAPSESEPAPPVAVAAPTPAPAPAPTTAPAVRRASEGELSRLATRKVPPQYPASARTARVEGTVVVEVEVDDSGKVAEAHALSGHALLRDAAVSAARKWIFKPGRLVGTIAFSFRL